MNLIHIITAVHYADEKKIRRNVTVFKLPELVKLTTGQKASK